MARAHVFHVSVCFGARMYRSKVWHHVATVGWAVHMPHWIAVSKSSIVSCCCCDSGPSFPIIMLSSGGQHAYPTGGPRLPRKRLRAPENGVAPPEFRLRELVVERASRVREVMCLHYAATFVLWRRRRNDQIHHQSKTRGDVRGNISRECPPGSRGH